MILGSSSNFKAFSKKKNEGHGVLGSCFVFKPLRSMRESSSVLMSRRTEASSASELSTWPQDPPMNNCDVFISFSKRDRQGDFASYLDKALTNVGLITMIDHSFGDELHQTLENIIQNSRCWIVVLSKDYVADERRLRVLAKIMDCVAETT